jgi:uncharacterized phage protein (TIGR01671 family)
MRDIKFRAWSDGIMYYLKRDQWWYFGDSGYCSLNDEWGNILCDSLESKDFYLMQYTGLKDKKGNEIYDGDIVKGFLPNDFVKKRIFQVIKPEFGHYSVISSLVEIEIIGNIHENKELLEDK